MLFAYTMITGRSVHTVAKSADVLDDKTVQKIDELANYIDEYYYKDYDKDDLENGLLHGVMEGLNDPYSVYYTADEYKELQISTTGTYYGIGAALKQDPDTKQVTVSKVYSGTPSEEAGLKKDDEIVSVDGVEATSEDLTKLVAKIRGEEGTKVTLEIRRGEDTDPFTVEVERKNVELPSSSPKVWTFPFLSFVYTTVPAGSLPTVSAGSSLSTISVTAVRSPPGLARKSTISPFIP